MNEPMSQEDFELACAECEGVKVSTIKAWRNSTGGYSNEKIDDMYLGYSLATAALEKQKAITRRVSAESNRLFDEKAVLIKQLEEAERERDELKGQIDSGFWGKMAAKNLARAKKAEAELARRDAAAGDPVAWQYRYNDGKVGDWHTVDSESECNHLPCYERRPIYTTAQPAVLPPNVMNHLSDAANTVSEWTHGDEHSCKVNRTALIAAVQALGAKPQKVVELPEPERHREPGIVVGMYESFVVYKVLDAANVKWEVMK